MYADFISQHLKTTIKNSKQTLSHSKDKEKRLQL